MYLGWLSWIALSQATLSLVLQGVTELLATLPRSIALICSLMMPTLMHLSTAVSSITAEHVVVLLLLCACVLYIGKVLFSFQRLGLSVTRGVETHDASSDTSDHEE